MVRRALTVFDDPTHYNVKHPLAERWTLWFDNPRHLYQAQNPSSSPVLPSLSATEHSAVWASSLRELITIDTVEDFFRVYNNLPLPRFLPAGCNYHLFKYGIRPEWEDTANIGGGKWVLEIPRSFPCQGVNRFHSRRNSNSSISSVSSDDDGSHLPRDPGADDLDKLWLNATLLCIGGILDEALMSTICGVVVSSRKSCFRLAFWTDQRISESPAMRDNFQKRLLMELEIPPGSSFGEERTIEFIPHDELKFRSSSMQQASHLPPSSSFGGMKSPAPPTLKRSFESQHRRSVPFYSPAGR